MGDWICVTVADVEWAVIVAWDGKNGLGTPAEPAVPPKGAQHLSPSRAH